MSNTATPRVSADLPELAAQGLEPFAGWSAKTPHLANADQKHGRKLCSSLEDAIKRSGLTDGGTISFHHHFREGDKVLLQVVRELARLGYKDLTLAGSSLNNCHAGLVEFIRSGVITKIYSSGMRGALAKEISAGRLEMAQPVNIHSHGGRVALMQLGELKPDVAFLGVSACDEFGNANGVDGRSHCGSLGYAKTDAQWAKCVVMVTEEIVDYPNEPASIGQDQVDFVVEVDEVGDPSRISAGAARITQDPKELLIARWSADVMENSGLFEDGFSMQTGTGGSATATSRFLERKMRRKQITAKWALGGITGSIADLHDKGLIETLLDVQSFDSVAAENLASSAHHFEISANQYASPFSKGACVDELDMVILSALEIDLNFNVNVVTGSDGVMMGASGGHCDTAAGAKLPIIVGPLLRGRIPTVVERVTTLVTPGDTVGCLVTDHGIAVNPNRPELAQRLKDAGLPVLSIEELYQEAVKIAGKPKPIEFSDKVVGLIRYRDGSVIDAVRALAS